MESVDHIDLLWTGGWDSTFRLLQLTLIEREKVQPYYITDPIRPSTPYELQTMLAIKELLFERDPETEKLVLPTIHFAKEDILPNEAITRRWRPLNKILLGEQYDWIARFAEQQELSALEICHEKKPKPSKFDHVLLPELIGEGHDCRLREKVESDDIKMFRNFRFPIVHLEKTDMERIAKEHGFFNLLERSWFCHSPKKSGAPCECCRPCRVARKAGHTHGMPPTHYLRDKWIYLMFKITNLLDRRTQRGSS